MRIALKGSTYNCMPELIPGIYAAFLEGKLDRARTLRRRANTVIEVICKYGVFASVKTLLSSEEFDFGPCQKPFAPMRGEGMQALRDIYERYLAK